jgi:DHA1 family multidrug resistance protein-like MFS transporter
MQPQNNRKNIVILFFTMIVVMLGFGMVIPIMPFYIRSFGASGSALGALMAIYGLLQFIFAPLWGSLSDRIGRKPVLMIGVIGNGLAQLLFGLSTELWMLFAARALSGILSSATLPTAMAYISDSTSEKERSGGMGIIGAAMGIGMVLGPGLAGLLAEKSLSLPFFLAAALSLIALGLVAFILPEPPRGIRMQHSAGSETRLRAMWQAINGPLGVLFFMSFLLTFGLTNFESVFGLYAADRYSYTPRQVGLILTVIGLVSAIMQGAATGPATRRFGEVNVIRATLVGSAIGFVLMILAQTYLQVMLSVCFFTFSNAMLNPAANSLISKRTISGQGITMGMSNSFQSLGRIAGPLWAGNIYDYAMNAPYLSGAAIMMAGFVISLTKLEQENPAHPVQEDSPPEVTN